MSKRICVLPPSQAIPLERTGTVPPCSRHHHCSESEALDRCRRGQARNVAPAKDCRYPKPAILVTSAEDYRPTSGQGRLPRNRLCKPDKINYPIPAVGARSRVQDVKKINYDPRPASQLQVVQLA
jgi:hypothetical protein